MILLPPQNHKNYRQMLFDYITNTGRSSRISRNLSLLTWSTTAVFRTNFTHRSSDRSATCTKEKQTIRPGPIRDHRWSSDCECFERTGYAYAHHHIVASAGHSMVRCAMIYKAQALLRSDGLRQRTELDVFDSFGTDSTAMSNLPYAHNNRTYQTVHCDLLSYRPDAC